MFTSVNVKAISPQSVEIDSKSSYVYVPANDGSLAAYTHNSHYGAGPGQTGGNFIVYSHGAYWSWRSQGTQASDNLYVYFSTDKLISTAVGTYMGWTTSNVHNYR